MLAKWKNGCATSDITMDMITDMRFRLKRARAPKIVPTTLLPFTGEEQFRFPRSKKKRIRKKWAKRKRNFRPKTISAIWFKGDLWVAERMYEAFMDRLKRSEDDRFLMAALPSVDINPPIYPGVTNHG